jgi:ectoine hydroxylase-related dioxygenase (phytanoyl-CoA dioxygenase family)
LHDLPPDTGGLEVAAGSHQDGVYEFSPALGAGGLSIADPLADTWTGGPFEAGDVLFFHSMTAHRGVANTGESRRLSIDARYQRLDAPIAPGSLLPHSQPNTWENVYLYWTDSRLQYYWRQYELHITDYDDSYHEERDRQAMELGAQGDQLSVSVLQRIIARDKDLQKRQRAAELLAAIEDDETTAP